MKPFKILSHPYVLVLSFLFIIISGEHLGGFYAQYLLLGLYRGILHSVLGFLGVVVLVINYHATLSKNRLLKSSLNLISVALLFASLYTFFARDTAHYNWGTFDQAVPMATIWFASFIALCFLVHTFWGSPLERKPRVHPLSKV